MEFVGNNHGYFSSEGGSKMEPEPEEETEMYTCGRCCKVFVDKGLLDLHQLEQHQYQQEQDPDSHTETMIPVVEGEFILGFDNAEQQLFDEILQGDDDACAWFDEEIINGIVLGESDPSTSALQVATDKRAHSESSSIKVLPQLPPSTTTTQERLSKEKVGRLEAAPRARKKAYQEASQRVVRICLQDIGRTLKLRCEFCKRRVLLAKLNAHQLAEHPTETISSVSRIKLGSGSRTTQRVNGAGAGVVRMLNGGQASATATDPSQPRRSYKCNFCGKSFVAQGQCKSHENSHKAEIEINQTQTETQTDMAQTPEAEPLPGAKQELESAEPESGYEINADADINVIETEKPEMASDNTETDKDKEKDPAASEVDPSAAESMSMLGSTSDTPPASIASAPSPKKKRSMSTTERESSKAAGRKLEPMAMKENRIIEGPSPHQHLLQTCLQCGDELLASALVPHIYQHVIKNQRQCPLCDHRAYSLLDLKDHITGKHYGLKPHVCSVCGSGFVWRSGLRGHEENCPASGKPFKCSACKARFVTNRERRRHELVHKSLTGPDGKVKMQNPRPRPRLNGGTGGVLKVKHNILSKKQSDGCGSDANTGGSSPELTSLLESYVKDPREEHWIELDPLTELPSESFLRSLTKPSAGATVFGGRGREETVTVAVAFPMTSSSSSGASAQNGGPVQNWSFGQSPPGPGHHNHSLGLSNNSFVAANLIQQQPQMQVPQPYPNQQQHQLPPAAPGPGSSLAPLPNHNHVMKVEPDEDGDGVGAEEEDEEDDEYYREEDKRYTEPPDTRTHETCKTCSQVVPMAELRAHIQSHVPKGQLECSICNYKAFNGKYLLDHLNIHYALKPYECDRCGRHFTFHGYLRSHIKQVHMQSKNRPHECRYCDKKFVRPCHRRTHERSHKGELPKDKRTTPTPQATPPSLNNTPPPGAPVQGFRTPMKRESFDMTTDLLSSPTIPKMTASWPPIAPQQQDPWLNPIQPQINPHPVQHQHQHDQQAPQQQYSTPAPVGSYYSQGQGTGPLYHQQQQQSRYGAPPPQPQHQQQRPPQPQSQGPLPSFVSTYASQSQLPHQPQQRLPPPQAQTSWGSPAYQQHQPPPLRYPSSPAGYMQQQQPVTPGAPSSPYFYAQQQQQPPQPPASYPPYSGGGGPVPPGLTATPLEPIVYNNNNNRFNQPQGGPTPVYTSQQQRDFGYQSPQQQQLTPTAPDSSISTISAPSTSTFDLWAELRDEELRLFPETNNLYPPIGVDPYASPSHAGGSANASSYLRTDMDPMLGPYYGEPPSQPLQQLQYGNSNYYAQDPFANPAPTPGYELGLSAGNKSFQPQQQHGVVARVKVKIRRHNGQSTLVNEPPPKFQQPARTEVGAGASRELIPAGGRRLSSDDLQDLQLQLTNSQCLVCDAALSGGQDILEHIASHLPRGGTHCAICDRTFAHSWYLKVHTYKHYGIKLYECTHCHRKFSKRHSLTAHIEQAHCSPSTESGQVCAICKKRHKTRFALRRHQQAVHGVVLKPESKSSAPRGVGPGAGAAGTAASSRRYIPAHALENADNDENEEMEIHVQGAHLSLFLRGWTVRLVDIGNQTRDCPICKDAVPIRRMLTHKTEHTETCHICGKEVPAAEIISHGSTHVSSLYCELCNWKGKQKSQIWEHMNGHLGHKPLKCEYCGVGFASRSSVRLHTIARHTNIRLHKCDFCDARFVTPQVKRMHQLQHYDTNCPYCNKYFALKKDLAVHIRRHYKMAGQKLVLKEDGEVDDDEEQQNQNGNGAAAVAGRSRSPGASTSFTDYDTSSNTSTSTTNTSMLSGGGSQVSLTGASSSAIASGSMMQLGLGLGVEQEIFDP